MALFYHHRRLFKNSFSPELFKLYRSITRVVSPDEYVYEMYMALPDGTEFKSQENHCLRKKS